MLTLHRVAYLAEGVFGVLLWQQVPFAVTVERSYPGQLNAQVPKVTIGTYTCERTWYNRGGYEVWQLIGGPITKDRLIYIHKGNLEDDSEGCILVGEQFGFLKGKPAVLQSGAAFQELMTLTADYDQLQLSVIN
jgi:hypothetical protein